MQLKKEHVETLALKLTPRRKKKEFEVIHVLVKTVVSHQFKTKTRVLSIFTRFDINTLFDALEFNRGVTYRNEFIQ